MNNAIVRRSTITKDRRWVAYAKSPVGGHIEADGTPKGVYCDYPTKAEAQAALDLYLEKQIIQERTKSKIKLTQAMRDFVGGATRDTDTTKLDYEAFNSPLVDKCYAEYLNGHRQTANGLRDGDNWQSLFGEKHFDVCMKSLCRHVVDARLAHRGYGSEQAISDSLNAIIFNAKAYLFKLLLDAEKHGYKSTEETTPGYGGNVNA